MLDIASAEPVLSEISVREAQLAERVAAEAARPFAVERETPLRAVLFTAEPDPVEPESVEPKPVGPEPVEQVAAEPRAPETETAEPGAVEPKTAEPKTAEPETGTPVRQTLLLVLHHIAADEWSLPPLLDDLAAAYTARLGGTDPICRACPWTTSTSHSGSGTSWPRTGTRTRSTGAPG